MWLWSISYSNASVASFSDTSIERRVVGMTTKCYIIIEAGPSHEELFDALKYAGDKEREFKVTFTALQVRKTGDIRQNSRRGKFTARIIGLMHDDGSGQSFIIDAYVSVKGLESKVVKFYYNTKQRTGRLDVA